MDLENRVSQHKVLVLIACSARKLPVPAIARELYQGQLFKSSVACAEAAGLQWAVLSAKHGLILPDEVLEPYEQRLSANRDVQRGWADVVARQVLACRPDRVIFLAGLDYRRYLTGILETTGVSTSAPLAGLQIGYQLSKIKCLCLGDSNVLGA